MPKTLYEFQEKGLNLVSDELTRVDSVIGVAPTGSGKCFLMCTAAYRYIQKSSKNVIIFVHKRELLQNTRRDLYDEFGIISQKIDAKTTSIDSSSRVFVAMVETFERRTDVDEFLNNFKNIGLFIVDEVHLGNFNKLIIHFLNCKRFGVTATPIASNKKFPLNKAWKSCIILAETEELLELNELEPDKGIVKCDAYSPENITRSDFKMKGDEYDEKDAGKKLSNPKHVKNTLDAYLKLAYGKKTIIFNSSIEHSLEVYQAFKDAGLNVRQLDSDKKSPYSSDIYRDETFKWLNETSDAILCNVGIATIGTDVKSIECILLNCLTASLAKLVQMIGRGARAYIAPDGTIKYSYLCIDMCRNFDALKVNPNKNIPWLYKFHNPKKAVSDGISPVKTCPECGALNSASTRICLAKTYIPLLDIEGECGYIFPVSESVEDLIPKEMVRLFNDSINVPAAIEIFKDRNEWGAYNNILLGLALLAKKEFIELEIHHLELIFENAYNKASEWFKLRNRNKFKNFRIGVNEKMIEKLVEVGFELDLDMVAPFLLKKEKVGYTI